MPFLKPITRHDGVSVGRKDNGSLADDRGDQGGELVEGFGLLLVVGMSIIGPAHTAQDVAEA